MSRKTERWWHHDDVIKWKHFPRNWPFVRGIHRSPVNSPHKGQWRGAFMFSLICVWINGWVNNREAGDLRHYRIHYDVTVMWWCYDITPSSSHRRPITGTFKRIFMNENKKVMKTRYIFIHTSLNVVLNDLINGKSYGIDLDYHKDFML